ncbi:MAG: FGGY-family carbohydrate kinase [Gallintestinimicrobium sp.]
MCVTGGVKDRSGHFIKEEDVKIDSITGHGGLFKTKGVGQSILAAAMNAPISVMETAGEGGAWGMALLAAYMLSKKTDRALGIIWTAGYLLRESQRPWSRI